MKYRIEVSKRAKATEFVFVEAESKDEALSELWAEDDELTVWTVEEAAE